MVGKLEAYRIDKKYTKEEWNKIMQNDPVAQYSSIFTEGTSVLNPNERTIWEALKSAEKGSVKVDSSFGELLEATIEQLDKDPKYQGIKDAHKSVKEYNKQMTEYAIKTTERSLGQNISEIERQLIDARKASPDAFEKLLQKMSDQITEKEKQGATWTEFWKDFLRKIGYGVLGLVGFGIILLLCGCHEAQLMSYCITSPPPGDPNYSDGNVRVTLKPEAQNKCKFSCAGQQPPCIDCCGGCGFFMDGNW